MLFNQAAAKILSCLALPGIFLVLYSATALAGDTKGMPMAAPSLVGTWSLRYVDNILPDGKRIHLYGDDPQGLLVFEADGHYSMQIMRGDRKRFAASDRAKATPEELREAYLGSNAHYGRYMVDNKAGALVIHIERATFPNWEGRDVSDKFTLKDGVLTYIVPTPTTGGEGVVGEVAWVKN